MSHTFQPPDSLPRRSNAIAKTATALTLGELYAWTLLIVGTAYWGNVVRTYPHDGPIGLVSVAQSVFGTGAFNIAAWAMVAVRAGGIAPDRMASRRQIAAAAAIALICAVPTRQSTIGALLALGIVLAVPSGTRYGRQVAALLFSLAAEMIWTSTYLLPLHTAAGMLDAQAVKAVLSLAGQTVSAHGNVVDNVAAGHSIELLAFCASSFALASIGLAYLVTTLYCGRLPGFSDLPWFAASALASVALTELRLSLMAVSETNYLWLHDGSGATVYVLAATALAVLFPMLASREIRPTAERYA